MKKFNIEIADSMVLKKGVESIIDFYNTLAIDKLELPGMSAYITGTDSPFLNVVIDTRTSAQNNIEIIKKIKDFFNQYNVAWSWLIMPSVKENNLEKFNFSLLEEAPGLYFDLTKAIPKETMNNDIIIKEVDQNDNLEGWIEPLQEGFPTQDNGESYRKLNADLLHKGEIKLRHFIAYCQNEIAGAATLFLSNDSVMLHNLAIKKAFQKRGIGRALALYRMSIAKQLGFKHCFLDASEDGFKLHRKLDFKIYCVTYFYSP